MDFSYPRLCFRMDLGAWASGARRTFPLSFFCDDVFGLGHLRPVLQVIFLSKSSDKNSQKPISTLPYCLISAFFLTFIFNLPFFSKACSALKFSPSDLWLLAVCAFVLFSAFFAVLRLLNYSFLIKAFSLFFTVCAAGALYFNYQYGTILIRR